MIVCDVGVVQGSGVAGSGRVRGGRGQQAQRERAAHAPAHARPAQRQQQPQHRLAARAPPQGGARQARAVSYPPSYTAYGVSTHATGFQTNTIHMPSVPQ